MKIIAIVEKEKRYLVEATGDEIAALHGTYMSYRQELQVGHEFNVTDIYNALKALGAYPDVVETMLKGLLDTAGRVSKLKTDIEALVKIEQQPLKATTRWFTH